MKNKFVIFVIMDQLQKIINFKHVFYATARFINYVTSLNKVKFSIYKIKIRIKFGFVNCVKKLVKMVSLCIVHYAHKLVVL
jgi:hypothetical protein